MSGGCRQRGFLLAWDQPSLPDGNVTSIYNTENVIRVQHLINLLFGGHPTVKLYRI
jgi:hypothetical protein